MHIIYAVSSCSTKVYRQLFADVAIKPAYHTQKYHRLLIEGLAAGAQVDVIATPPVNKSVMKEAVLRIPDEEEGGARYFYNPAIRNPYRKLLSMAAGTFFKTLTHMKKDSVVVVDCLNRTVALFAMLAARLCGHRCVGIVTDIPAILSKNKLAVKVSNFIIRGCTDYVLLTDAMADYLQVRHKPYVVLEGHSDMQMKDVHPSLDKKLQPRVCMYAGCIAWQYGLRNLIDGFLQADLKNVQLHLYGPCDDEEEIRRIASEDSRIFYGGMLLNTDVVDKEMEASLLINPRPTHEEFVKYSFPSKTMEYMASGTPVLTTVLPSMPEDYHPYVYLLEDETADGIAKKLTQLMALSDEELYEKGQRARTFILTTRNNVIQASKILDMLKQ